MNISLTAHTVQDSIVKLGLPLVFQLGMGRRRSDGLRRGQFLDLFDQRRERRRSGHLRGIAYNFRLRVRRLEGRNRADADRSRAGRRP